MTPSFPLLASAALRCVVAGTKYSIAQRFTFGPGALPFLLCVPASTKDDVERACPAMPGMGVAHGRDMGGVSRGREPVTHGRAYRTSLDRPALVGRRLAGDEQHHPRAHRHGLFELQVEQMVSVGEVVAVQEIGRAHV